MEFLFLISGLIIGVTGTYMIWKSTTSTIMTKDQFMELDKEKCLIEDRYRILKQNHEKLQETLVERECSELDLREHLARAEGENRNLQGKLLLDRVQHQELHQKYTDQFEGLVQRLFRQNVNQLTDMNQERLELILTPLQEKIRSFQKQVEDSQKGQILGSKLLQEEIEKLVQLNNQISEDAQNLTQALKGNNNAEGQWGEIHTGSRALINKIK